MLTVPSATLRESFSMRKYEKLPALNINPYKIHYESL